MYQYLASYTANNEKGSVIVETRNKETIQSFLAKELKINPSVITINSTTKVNWIEV